MNDDNTVKVQRSEETLVAGDPPGTVVSETTTSADTGAVVAPADTTVVRSDDATVVASTTAPASHTTVQSTATSTTPSDRVISHQVSERVIDPAAEKAATVGWINRLIWFIIGIMAVLLAIRFVLELAGANPNAGFAQLIDGLTDWMVAPFAGLFGAPINVADGAATTSRFAPEILVAIIVYLLIGFLITKLAELLLGTNRTTGTVVSDTERNTRV
jgi:uncharacterized protein YggT (Ycf19 family)